MANAKEWVRNRRAEGLLWKSIRQELIDKHSWSYEEAHNLILEVKAEVEAEEQEEQETETPEPDTEYQSFVNQQHEQQQEEKKERVISIRLSQEELQALGTQSPSQVIHKLFQEYIHNHKSQS